MRNHTDNDRTMRYSNKVLLDEWIKDSHLSIKKEENTSTEFRSKPSLKLKEGYYYQIIPEKILLNFPIIEELIQNTIKGYSGDNLKEIISTVAFNIRKKEASIPLKMAYLRKLVPQGDRYLFALIDIGIVQRSGKYIPGEKSYCYDFSPEYKSKFISLPLTNAKLIRRIKLVYDSIRKESRKQVRGLIKQADFLEKLTITDEAFEYIETLQNIEQYNYYLSSATKIRNQIISYSIDETSNRFHSNVTNMPWQLRQCLRIDGKPLVNIDVKNSQPYLSTILLTQPSKVSWLTENPVFAMLLQSLKVSQNEDVKKYISLVATGQIYEYLMQEFGGNKLQLSRDDTKRQVLRILFARNRMPKEPVNRACREIFKENFPTVYKIFSKVRGHEKGDKFQNFKRFSILLQRIESYLMLDVIVKRIYKELPGVIAITIHDSIMTGILTNDIESVKRIMEEELTFFVGFPPKIKIERNNEEIGENKYKEYYDAITFININ